MAKPTRNRLSTVVCLTLALVTAALYWPMLQHDFIGYYDDDAYLTRNAHVNAGLTWSGVVWAFQSGYAANWHPLTWISHMLDCQLYGLNPWGHHLTNLLFHVANTLLLFAWLKQLTGTLWRSAFVAALFAWHPLHVESVAWAAERKDVLSAFFWMLTLIAYSQYVQKSEVRSPTSKAFYMFALAFFALGLMSKPMVVTLPFVLLLIDFWPLNRFSKFQFLVPSPEKDSTLNSTSRQAGVQTNQPSTRSIFRLICEKMPFFALALAASIITYSIQQTGGAFWSLNALPLRLRLANALVSYVRYISKTFWPADLALIYPYPHHWPALLVSGAALLLVIWSGLFLWRARRNPYLFTGWFWYLGTLVPAIGLVQVGVQSMADRYLYLPGIGLFIILAWGLNDLLRLRPHWQRPVLLACGTALAACLAVTEIQLCYWQNSLKLFMHTVEVTTDNYCADTYLGNVLEQAGDKEDALSLYAQAVRIQPDFPLGQFNLGMVLLKKGRLVEASNHLAIAAQLMPRSPQVQYDFGLFLSQQGRPEEAISRFNAALLEKPDFLEALNQLAWILATNPDAKIRSGPEAVRLARRACELTQNQQVLLLMTLSAACAEKGQYPDAIANAQKAGQLARAAGQTNIVVQDELLMKCYQAGHPFHESH